MSCLFVVVFPPEKRKVSPFFVSLSLSQFTTQLQFFSSSGPSDISLPFYPARAWSACGPWPFGCFQELHSLSYIFLQVYLHKVLKPCSFIWAMQGINLSSLLCHVCICNYGFIADNYSVKYKRRKQDDLYIFTFF